MTTEELVNKVIEGTKKAVYEQSGEVVTTDEILEHIEETGSTFQEEYESLKKQIKL